MNPDFIRLNNYVTCVEMLAKSVENDIKDGKTISDNTVLRLSKLIAATAAVSNLLDVLDKDNSQLN